MSSVKKNYIYNVLYEILIIVLPLITSPYISRVLGPENIGIYTYQYSIVSYFVMFARLGIVNYGSRTVAAAKSDEERSKVFSNTFAIQGTLAFFTTVLYIGYVVFGDLEYSTMGLIMLLYLLTAALDVNWFFFGIEQFRITVVRNTVIKLISTALLFMLVKQPDDLNIYGIILGGSNLLGQLATWPYVGKYIKIVKPEIREVRRHFYPIVVLFVPQIAVSLYKMMDKIMIGALCSKSQLGYYEYASMIVNLPLGFITSLGTVMIPRISSLMKDGDNKTSQIYTHNSILFATGLSIAFAFGLSGIAPVFVPFYFGDEFWPTTELLIGLAVTLPFLAWANVVRTQYLIPAKRDKEYIASLFSGAGINIVINMLLIPRYQAWGAVIGTIAAEVTVCITQTWTARRYLPIGVYIKECSGFIAIGAVMGATVSALGLLGMPVVWCILLQISVGAAVFLSLAVIYVKYVLKLQLPKMW